MAKHTAEELVNRQAQAVVMHGQGATMPEIQAALALNYSQAWWGIAEASLTPELDHRAMAAEDKPASIVESRNAGGTHSSWGWLAVRYGMPESRVRKLYTETSNVRHRGLRNGKGGRFMEDNDAYYQGANRKVGHVSTIGDGPAMVPALARQLLPEWGTTTTPTTMLDLRKAARAAGHKPSTKATRAELLALLQA